MIFTNIVDSFTPSVLIELGMLCVATIGILLKISADNTKTKLAINENSLKILRLEKDYLQLKVDYEKQINEMKILSFQALEKLYNENREDHQLLFEKIGEAVVELTKASTAFDIYVKQTKK